MPFPVAERFIVEAEAKLGVVFPHSYRQRMMRSNGGDVSTPPDAWQLYPFWDKSDKKRLKRTCNDIVRETDQAREWEQFPPNAIAIGANGCGDQLIFLPDPERPSESNADVYWRVHENGDIHHIAEDIAQLR